MLKKTPMTDKAKKRIKRKIKDFNSSEKRAMAFLLSLTTEKQVEEVVKQIYEKGLELEEIKVIL
jgi:hypothetical protein